MAGAVRNQEAANASHGRASMDAGRQAKNVRLCLRLAPKTRRDHLENDAQNAIHFVLDLPAIDAITIGMKNKQEIDDNIGYVTSHDTALQPV